MAVRACGSCDALCPDPDQQFCEKCGTQLPNVETSSVSVNLEPLRDSDPATIGDYTLQGRLGSGGFGVVYAAEASDNSPVALKVLRAELSDDQRFRRRLAREAEALRRVEGNRTVKIIDVVTDADRAYLVMELLEGSTFDDQVEKQGPLQSAMLWFAAQGLVEALHDIHSADIIHRDLKPSNVIYGPDGIKVLDFGISVVAEETSLTQTGAFMGTAAWISPEQIRGEEVTEATDVFNFGLVMAFAATGHHPYGEGRSDALMYRISSDQPDLSEVPSPVKEALESCLQKDPTKRPSIASLAEFFNSNGATGLDGESSDTVIVSPDALDEATNSDDGAGPTGTRIVQPELKQQSDDSSKRKVLTAIVASVIAVAAVASAVAFQSTDKNAELPAQAAAIPSTNGEDGGDEGRNEGADNSPATTPPCKAPNSENKARTDRSNIRYINVIPRANHTSSFLFDNLRYEGNNINMRTASPIDGLPLPSAEEVSGRWRALIQKTAGIFVLRDSLWSQQDHPYKHGVPCALMMPPNWITAAIIASNPVPMNAPPTDDDIAWQEMSDDPSSVFGSFPISETLHRLATKPSASENSAWTLAARSTIRLLAAFAAELLQTRENLGTDAAIARGAELIATSDYSYFGSTRAKVIPIMMPNPSEAEIAEGKGFSISGIQVPSDVLDEIMETVMRRRLQDGDIALERYDLSTPVDRSQAIATLSRLIPPDAPPGGVVWIWVNGRLDPNLKLQGEDATAYIELFKRELNVAAIDLTRLNFVSKPTVEFEGLNLSDQFENELDRYESLGLPLSVNTDAKGVSQWMRQS